MQASEVLSHLSESLASNRVYAEPVKQDGVTVIPAAAVRGGGGVRRNGEADEGRGGMGITARPVGAYVISGSEVKWKPALDLSRAIFRGQVVVFTALLVVGLLRLRR
jgi:uncharacterized spore protein YtfJ